MPNKKRILSQMFDVKPVRRDGSLNLEMINSVQKTVVISGNISKKQKIVKFISTSDIKRGDGAEGLSLKKDREKNAFETVRKTDIPKYYREARVIRHGRIIGEERPDFQPEQHQPYPEYGNPEILMEYGESCGFEKNSSEDRERFEKGITTQQYLENISLSDNEKKKGKLRPRANGFFLVPFKLISQCGIGESRFGFGMSFIAVLLIFSLIIPIFSFMQEGMEARTSIISNSEQALGKVAQAKDDLMSGQFNQAASSFDDSYELLGQANKDIIQIGGKFSEILRLIPGASKIATANYMIEAGQSMSLAGKHMSNSVQSLDSLSNPLNREKADNQPTLVDIFLNLRDGTKQANEELKKAEASLEKVNPSDLPDEIRPDIVSLKDKLPVVIASIDSFLENSQIILDILGFNGPRKFLFLFQNNQEMRATGGFIGSYGILDVSNGRVKKLFVDDIYNPDGQLKARVIPPGPIQKMSAVWTMHDANWFPDFPTSAEKLSWFYEKTGGPTVDGVIAVTPKMIEDLLEITGPIDMPEYGTTVDKNNFIEKTQYEVEVDYDKDLNRPKKFIADLTPKILDQIFNTRNMGQAVKILNIFGSLLKEKHLLIYSKNYNLQKLISSQGWSGEILNQSKDYLSVINTNISGYKTDGVIDETIRHTSEISGDGRIVDTVTVTRKHNGGNEKYEWWNKVNSDYVRVYVPEGSKLLEVSGQTREFVSPPIDYKSLGFKQDPQVKAEEDSTVVDENSGTRIYTENHKTVFANWTYVSPGESVELTYKYELPFKLSFDPLHHPADNFSVLYQKQPGSIGSKLFSEIKMPQNFQTIWRWPDNISGDLSDYKMDTTLNTDRYWGVAIQRQ